MNFRTSSSAMTGIACYASPFDDPNLNNPSIPDDDDVDDDTDEDDREDFELKADDNLVIVGRVVKVCVCFVLIYRKHLGRI